MKRLFFAAILLSGISCVFCSCSKSEDEEKQDLLVGCWVDTDLIEENELYSYIEFTSNGLFYWYEFKSPEGTENEVYPTFENGTLYLSKGYSWERQNTWEYWVKEGYLFSTRPLSTGMKIVSLGNDKVVLQSGENGDEEVYLRVKQFKTKE